jgi:hypothetical protein
MYQVNGWDYGSLEVGRPVPTVYQPIRLKKLKAIILGLMPQGAKVEICSAEGPDIFPSPDCFERYTLSINLNLFGYYAFTMVFPLTHVTMMYGAEEEFAERVVERFMSAYFEYRRAEREKREAYRSQIPFCEVEGCGRRATQLTRDIYHHPDDGFWRTEGGDRHAYCDEHFKPGEEKWICRK